MNTHRTTIGCVGYCTRVRPLVGAVHRKAYTVIATKCFCLGLSSKLTYT